MIRQLVMRGFQPLSLIAIVAFWGLAPDALVARPATLIVALVAIMGTVLAMEAVSERHAGWRLTWREFATDVFYVVLTFTVIDWCTDHFGDGPLLAVKQHFGLATPWVARWPYLVQIALVVFLIEFGQYWMHRAMHNWIPLWLIHAPHHHITQLNALKGAVGNPIELWLISLSVVALFDVSERAIFAAASILMFVSSCAHANVRFITPRWYALLFTTIENHSLHHSVPYADTRCNYANSLILIDRVLGTYRAGEAMLVGQGDRRRLSIAEQFRFPFGPLIALVRGKNQPSAG